jgi:XRE family transcriptional regulator, regulator of sulfur utilization
MNIGTAIRNIRKERTPQLNQSEFAKLIGITQTYLSQIETGAKTPNISVLETISKEFEIPLPIIFWLSIEEGDVAEHRREYFRFLKPTVDSMIDTFF